MWHDRMARGVAATDADKYPGADARAQEASLTLIRTFGTLNSLMNDYLAPFGLSRPRLHALHFLNHAPGGQMRMSDIGTSLRVARPNVTTLVDGLERQGLVERIADPTDRRTTYTRITEAGRQRLTEVMPEHLRRLGELWQGLSDEETDMLTHLLAKARGQLLLASGTGIEPTDRSFPA